MNTIQLKQLTRKEKEEQQKQNQKKKQIQRQVPLDLNQENIKNRLLIHFQNHIGEQNKTTLQELFEVCIGLNPLMVDSFARMYWIEIIKKMMRSLRSKDRCFILKKDKGYFVLQDTIECEYYKRLCDNAIKKMEKSKIRAEDWVEEEKWRTMENPSEENEEIIEKSLEERKKSVSKILPEEKMEDYKDKLKTKVIKLWKNEEK